MKYVLVALTLCLSLNAVQALTTGGGYDLPEATFDALLAAKDTLSWNRDAKRSVVVISDAAPHPRTLDRRYNEADVAERFKAAGTDISICPILSGE